MSAQSTFEFHWLSPLGISVALFLGYGVLNTLVGLTIPGLSRRLGTNGLPQYRVDLLSMLWLAFGLFQLSLVWFGLQQGQIWALWILAAADLVQLAGWIFYGIQTHDWYAPLFLYAAVFVVPAILLGWFGLR